MGAIFSLFKSHNEDDYEKILADLEDEIQKIEVRLSDIKARERKFVLIFLIYSLFAYGLYLVTYFVYLRDPHDGYYAGIWKLLPAFGSPVSIYYVSRGVSYWYNRKRLNEETHLETLKIKQRQKVEELKKKTAYYSTKNLLDRYDTPTKSKPGKNGNEGPKTPLHNANLARAQGRLIVPNSAPANPNLRQRNTPGKPQDPRINGTPTAVPGPRNPSTSSSKDIKNPNIPALPPSGPINGINPTQVFSNHIDNQQNNWYDKIIDVIVGQEGPNTKYALICKNCFAHNGLALPNEIEDIQYHCPKCNFLNPSRRSRLQPQHTQTPMNKTLKSAPKESQIRDKQKSANIMTPTPAENPIKANNEEINGSENDIFSSSDENVDEAHDSENENFNISEGEHEKRENVNSSQDDECRAASSDEAEFPVEPVRETVLKNKTDETPLRQRKKKSGKKN
ncbi:hypothetical protein K7432_002944 [Basidiobolus ranarum]|uniref:Endoplasmic reticulum junction formation protein lunapark n=1 Tax=Basidiobolus ranarum TaxID=34480 RepID=A0ABR2W7X7_9FUNG